MDLGIIIAIVGSSIAIIGVTITLLLWTRGESRADWRNLQDQIIEDRREFIALINEMKLESKNFRIDINNLVNGINLENKDFHHRLLEIERARK